ncbi:hypothetical protein SUDANB23_03989 [Streptomyces sp. enrichment culture]
MPGTSGHRRLPRPAHHPPPLPIPRAFRGTFSVLLLIAAVALFRFLHAWNDYFAPRIHASENPAAWTLSHGLQPFKGAHHTGRNLTMAATVPVMAPVVLVFFFARKAFVEGVTLTGVKGQRA